MALKVAPKLVEWKRPMSVETQTSPATVGWTAILYGEEELTRFPPLENVLPASLEI